MYTNALIESYLPTNNNIIKLHTNSDSIQYKF